MEKVFEDIISYGMEQIEKGENVEKVIYNQILTARNVNFTADYKYFSYKDFYECVNTLLMLGFKKFEK